MYCHAFYPLHTLHELCVCSMLLAAETPKIHHSPRKGKGLPCRDSDTKKKQTDRQTVDRQTDNQSNRQTDKQNKHNKQQAMTSNDEQ